MNQNDLLKEFADLKDRFHKAQRQASGLKQKAKYLELQYGDARDREHHTNDLVMELLERQRELNVMLNRANIMLNRTQEVMALTSMEFNEMAKALPEPKKAEWSDRISKVNDLFKKTGIQDAEVVALESSSAQAANPLSTDELKKESEEAFPRKTSVWGKKEKQEPLHVEAEVVEEPEHREAEAVGVRVISGNGQRDDEDIDEESLVFPPQRKSWWRRSA